jgi:methylisocitrate lyase
MALYPLSASRAMNKAAARVLTEIRAQGSQAGVVAEMQTRAELYELLDYEKLERRQRHG